MKLIVPSYKILSQSSGLEGIYKIIEESGRTCYQSFDKITETSAKDFVDRMVKSGHGAMLEHGTVYMMLYADNPLKKIVIDFYKENPYSKINIVTDNEGTYAYITTNYRVLVENDILDDLKYMCEPTKYHEKRVTVKFTLDQGIMREFTRHRTMSFACESTRYCNYSKGKYNNEITFIKPCWDLENVDEFIFKLALEDAEKRYMQLIEQGWKPQQARSVLPLATKCELVMTGFVSDWKHFFNLRTEQGVHPQARELAIPLKEEFVKLGY